jgi:hypothetical protein
MELEWRHATIAWLDGTIGRGRDGRGRPQRRRSSPRGSLGTRGQQLPRTQHGAGGSGNRVDDRQRQRAPFQRSRWKSRRMVKISRRPTSIKNMRTQRDEGPIQP